MRRVVESRNFVSFVLSAAIGLYLFRSWPFPAANNVLRMALLQKPYLFYASKYAFTAMLFTTPYIILSVLFSSAYIFIVRHEEEVSLARLSEYPQPAMRDELFHAIGEIHQPRLWLAKIQWRTKRGATLARASRLDGDLFLRVDTELPLPCLLIGGKKGHWS